MTRRSLNTHIFRFVSVLLLLMLIAAAAKFAKFVGFPFPWLDGIYQFIIDMSLLIFTIGAAYLANIFQRRANFISSLKEEWHEIVRAKSSLIGYIDNEDKNPAAYLEAYQHLSCCIDYMRIVYRNVGETEKLIGLYPYEPLHDMRRALEAIAPAGGPYGAEELQQARRDIWESFNALRERFLEELDLEEPAHPLIGEGARRKKKRGARGFKDV